MFDSVCGSLKFNFLLVTAIFLPMYSLVQPGDDFDFCDCWSYDTLMRGT